MSIEVIKPGLLTSLQDAGRPAYAHLGVAPSGAFDGPALRIANALCGNPANACGLEITLLGPTLHFHADALIALTGAPLAFRVDGVAQPQWAPVFVAAGSAVELGAVRTGCRSYLAVAGGIDVATVLGSRSSDVNAALGPFDGRPLRAGDRLAMVTTHSRRAPVLRTPKWQLDPRPWFDENNATALRLMHGSHFESVAQNARNLLFSESFTVLSQSNRVGLRLSGPALSLTHAIEMVSEACVPGLLQLPPSGQPIAFGPECPASGGYPRIGQIAAVDLPRLAQLRPGDGLRFQPCTLDEALAALDDRERGLSRVEANIRARLQA